MNIADLDKRIAAEEWTGILHVRYLYGKVLDASRMMSTVPMTDQVEGVMQLIDSAQDGQVDIIWSNGIVRHAQVREPIAVGIESVEPDHLRSLVERLCAEGFHGTLTVTKKSGTIGNVDSRRTWKAERKGDALEVLGERTF